MAASPRPRRRTGSRASWSVSLRQRGRGGHRARRQGRHPLGRCFLRRVQVWGVGIGRGL